MPKFVEQIGEVCARYEIGHAIGDSTGRRAEEGDGLMLGDAPASTDLEPLDGDVMVVIDYGCPFAHMNFRDAAGSRVRYLWFQDSSAVASNVGLPRVNDANGRHLFPYGRELTGAAIDALLAVHAGPTSVDESACYEAIGYGLMREAATHGGHVMDIAGGTMNIAPGVKRGPLFQDATDDWLTGTRVGPPGNAGCNDNAGKSKIIFVELPRAAVGDSSGGGMNIYLVDALQYVLARTDPNANVVVNCSFGTNAGPHDGTSMLERAIDSLVRKRPTGKFTVVVPAGNSFNSACHAAGRVTQSHPLNFTVDVAPEKATDTFIELWYEGNQPLQIAIAPPFGVALARVAANQMASWSSQSHSHVPLVTIIHSRDVTPSSHMALVVIAPTRPRDTNLPEAPYGHWQLSVTSDVLPETEVDAWIERDDPIFDSASDRQSRFVTTPQVDDQEEYASATVTKFGTLNSYASAGCVYAAGAAIMPTRRFNTVAMPPQMSSYSSAGSDLVRTALNRPDFVAYADDSAVLPGRNAAGSRSRTVVRLNGTSVAAPQIARDILNSGGPYGTAIPFRPGMGGARGDGLSAQGEYVQLTRAGLGLLVP